MLRDHLTKAWEASGNKPQALETPPAPHALAYLMQWFRQLAAKRQVAAMGGPLAITWGEMQAWSQLMGLHLAAWQAQALARLDDLWRAAWMDGREKSPADRAPPARRGGPERRR